MLLANEQPVSCEQTITSILIGYSILVDVVVIDCV